MYEKKPVSGMVLVLAQKLSGIAWALPSWYGWLNEGFFGHWEFRAGKLLFGGHSSKLLRPNAQCLTAIDLLPKQPLLN